LTKLAAKPSVEDRRPSALNRMPTRDEAEAAVRTLLAWAGDDPDREGLAATPARVAAAFQEYFSGYRCDPLAELGETFEEVAGYDDMVMLRDIRLESHCEHHIAPFIGVAHIAYVPDGRIIGISKLARVTEILARRLQTQERLTAEIAAAVQKALAPRGVAVAIAAEHQCMSLRGVRQPGVTTLTQRFLGVLETEPRFRDRFLQIASTPRSHL